MNVKGYGFDVHIICTSDNACKLCRISNMILRYDFGRMLYESASGYQNRVRNLEGRLLILGT